MARAVTGSWSEPGWGTAPWGGGGTATATPTSWVPYPALPAEALPQWAVHVRNRSWQLVGQLATWARIEGVARMNDVGGWTVTFAASDPAAGLALAAQAGVVITRDDRVISTGPVRDIEIEHDRDGTWVTISGPDDMCILADRVAKAEPTVEGPAYVGSRYDARTGPASTILRQFVAANAAGAATPDRQVAGLTIDADPTVGQSMTEKARYTNLLRLCRRIARRSNPDIIFRVQHGDRSSGTWRLAEQAAMTIDAARDRTDTVIWTEQLGGIDRWTWRAAAPEATWVIDGGDIDAGHRLIAEAGDPAALAAWGRIEQFKDDRQIDNYAELAASIAETVDKIATSTSFEVDLGDGPGPPGWGTDWDLGDRITVSIAGRTFTERIREIGWSVDETGEHVAPKIGGETAQFGRGQAQIHRMLRSLAERAGALEEAY